MLRPLDRRVLVARLRGNKRAGEVNDVETGWDFATIAIFAAMIGLFLHRSIGDREDPIPIWQYAVAAIGCAVTNQLGNEGLTICAVLLLAATLGYIGIVLKPFGAVRKR